MNTKQQQGSGHELILVIIGVVVIIGVLGFIFWKNYMGNHDAHTTTQTQTQTKPTNNTSNLTESASLTLEGRTISVKYPKGWTVDKQDADLSVATDHESSMQLTSSDKAYSVSVNLTDGGFGGTCAPGLKVHDASTTKLSNGTGELLYDTISAADSEDSTKYIVSAQVLAKDTDTSKLGVGQDSCSPSLAYRLFSSKGDSLSDSDSNPIMASASVAPLAGSQSLSDAKQAWSSKEYQTAKQILLSLRG